MKRPIKVKLKHIEYIAYPGIMINIETNISCCGESISCKLYYDRYYLICGYCFTETWITVPDYIPQKINYVELKYRKLRG